MKNILFLSLFLFFFPFKSYSMELSNNLPETFYDQRCDEFIKKFDFTNNGFKQKSIQFLKIRIAECQKSITLTESYEIKISNEKIFCKEYSFVNSKIIKAILKTHHKSKDLSFMFYFAKFVEENTMSLLQMQLKQYYKNSTIESFAKSFGWEEINKEKFNNIIKKSFTEKKLNLLKVSESAKFADWIITK
ncbi:hypothetical protein ACFLYH_02070, partial [Candidatus Dependentiae bacterium]